MATFAKEKKILEVYITKYALTSGSIIVADAELWLENDSQRKPMITVKTTGVAFCGSVYYHGDDWHTTKEDALAHVEKMKKAKSNL